jgi:BirA family biotin operon repressor/biotin-[acetyl-CoA-carboxylase] ligase
VRADRQTAGRGRRGRHWVSEAGNLFTSTLIRPQEGEGPRPQLSFVAALAMHDMAARFAARERLSLKWPNDVLLDGVKCTGILLEGRGEAVILGIGVNLSHHPEGTERAATSFPAAGLPAPDPAKAAEALAAAFADRRRIWREQGFAPVRAAWLDRTLHREGDRMAARLPGETRTGRYAGLDEKGALRLRREDGRIDLIGSGEVFAL